MSCGEWSGRAEEARLGLLGGPERERYEAHLAACAGCRKDAREAAEFERLLDGARAPDRDLAVAEWLAARVRVRRRRRRAVLAVLGAAACLLVAAVLAGGSRGLPRERPVELASGERAALEGVAVTAIEAARLVASADGRVVRLERGSARFSVTPGRGAFAVVTPNGRIDVTGTEFEVRIMTRWQAGAGSAVVAVLVATGAVMFTNDEGAVPVRANEILVARPGEAPRRFSPEDVANLLEDNERLRSTVSRLTGELANATAAAAPPTGETAPTEEPEAADVPGSVAATDWGKFGDAVATIIEMEKNPNAEPTPESLTAVAYFMARLNAMSEELGYDDPEEVLYDPEVLPLFLRAMAASLLPELPRETVDRLSAGFARIVREKAAVLPPVLLPLEKYLRDTEIAAEAVIGLRGSLTEDQIGVLVPLLDAQTMVGFATYSFTATSRGVLGAKVRTELAERFGLDESEAALAGPTVERFVSRHLDVRRRMSREHGRDLAPAALRVGGREAPLDPPADRVDLLRVRAAILREQAAAEREIYELLDEEGRKRILDARVTLWLLGEGE